MIRLVFLLPIIGYIMAESKPLNIARETCKGNGGILVNLDDDSRMQATKTFFGNHPMKFWTGGHYVDKTWKWSNGLEIKKAKFCNEASVPTINPEKYVVTLTNGPCLGFTLLDGSAGMMCEREIVVHTQRPTMIRRAARTSRPFRAFGRFGQQPTKMITRRTMPTQLMPVTTQLTPKTTRRTPETTATTQRMLTKVMRRTMTMTVKRKGFFGGK